jgi:hypothetical protein
MLEVRGYSERGMINGFFYEMRYSPEALQLLEGFLKEGSFPDAPNNNPRSRMGPLRFDRLQGATIVVEQSFSDFGDADILILMKGRHKMAVFVEAKVKTYQAPQWTIQAEWAKFQGLLQLSCPGLDPKERRRQATSNLFVQLYRKARLVRQVWNPGESLPPDAISQRWSLGNNQVIHEAARLLSDYGAVIWYLAIVPDTEENVRTFYEEEFRNFRPDQALLPGWDNIETWGFMTWERLRRFCLARETVWPDTLANFLYNEGQIYALNQGALMNNEPPPPGSAVTWTGDKPPRLAVVVRRGRENTRIRFNDGTESVVANGQLAW